MVTNQCLRVALLITLYWSLENISILALNEKNEWMVHPMEYTFVREWLWPVTEASSETFLRPLPPLGYSPRTYVEVSDAPASALASGVRSPSPEPDPSPTPEPRTPNPAPPPPGPHLTLPPTFPTLCLAGVGGLPKPFNQHGALVVFPHRVGLPTDYTDARPHDPFW